MDKKKSESIPSSMNFVFGGISGCIATSILHPIDVIKTQIQLKSERGDLKIHPFEVAKSFLKNNKFSQFYRGLDSALLRVVLYTTTRFGLFYSLKDSYDKKHPSSPAPLYLLALYAAIGGGVGAVIANPADLVLVRVQADFLIPDCDKRNYKNVFQAIRSIAKHEGLKALWNGTIPTSTRAIVLNIFMFAPFEEIKLLLLPVVEDIKMRAWIASLIASFLGSVSCLPFDNCKTKLQNEAKNGEAVKYSGQYDCLKKTIKNEGIKRLWVGFFTFYMRTGPHILITLLMNDVFRYIYIKDRSLRN